MHAYDTLTHRASAPLLCSLDYLLLTTHYSLSSTAYNPLLTTHYSRQPVLDILRSRVLDPSASGAPCELLDLCPELKFGILAHLDRYALCRMAAACSSLRDLATDDTLWAAIFEKSFGSTSDVQAGFARAYRGHHLAAREAERQAQRARPYRGETHDPFSFIPGHGPFPGGFPGGGPHGGGMPGFAGQVPGSECSHVASVHTLLFFCKEGAEGRVGGRTA